MSQILRKTSKILIMLLVSLLMVPLMSGCGSKDPLVGTWKEPVTGITLVFDENNNVTVSLNQASYKVTYAESDPNVLTIKLSSDGTIPDVVMNYSVTKDQLTLTVDGVDTVFNREK